MTRTRDLQGLSLTKPIVSTEPSKASIGQSGRAAEVAGRLLHDGPHQPRLAHHGQVRAGRHQAEVL